MMKKGKGLSSKSEVSRKLKDGLKDKVNKLK